MYRERLGGELAQGGERSHAARARRLRQREHFAPGRGRLLEPAIATVAQPQAIPRLGPYLEVGGVSGPAVAAFRADAIARPLVDPAQRQRLTRIAARTHALFREPHRTCGDRGKRDEVQTVVLEHRLERTRI